MDKTRKNTSRKNKTLKKKMKLSNNLSLWVDPNHGGCIRIIDHRYKLIDDSCRSGHAFVFGNYTYVGKKKIMIKWPNFSDRKSIRTESAILNKNTLTFTGGEFSGNKWIKINSGRLKEILIKHLKIMSVTVSK
jgi:hypothetical protein